MFDLGLPYPGDLTPPEGYCKISWDTVGPGEEVFIACLDLENRRVSAKGPYQVLKPYLLKCEETQQEIQEIGDRLLRRSSSTAMPSAISENVPKN